MQPLGSTSCLVSGEVALLPFSLAPSTDAEETVGAACANGARGAGAGAWVTAWSAEVVSRAAVAVAAQKWQAGWGGLQRAGSISIFGVNMRSLKAKEELLPVGQQWRAGW